MTRVFRAAGRGLRAVHDWAASAPGTYIWLLALYVTTYVYLHLEPHRRTPFLKQHSTNLRHLDQDPVSVLLSSAVWAEGSHLIKFTVMFTLIFAVAERWMGTWRWLAVAALGHVGATYVSQFGVLLGIEYGPLPLRLRNVVDVGPSYALMAVAGVLFHRFAGPLRWWYLAVLGAYVGIPLFVDRDFTAVGHVCAAAIGVACRQLVQHLPRRSTPTLRLSGRILSRSPER